MNSLKKFSLQLDMHRWEKNEQPCQLSTCKDKTHGMQCADCGIHRFGPFAEQGCYHYFTYEHPDGTAHEVIPPCGEKVPNPRFAMFDTVKVCCSCGHLLDEDLVAERCKRLCTEKDTGKPAGIKELKLVRAITKLEQIQ